MTDEPKRRASDFAPSSESRLNLMQAQLHEITKALGKMPEQEQKTGMERHAQTVLAAVTIGLIGWVGISVTEGSNALAKMEVITGQLQEEVRELKSHIRNATDSHVGKDEMREARNKCEEGLQHLDGRVRKLEGNG